MDSPRLVGAVCSTDRTAGLTVRAVFGGGIAIVTFLAGILDTITADVNGPRLVGAVCSTDRAAGLTVVAVFGCGIAVVAGFVAF